MKKYTKEEAEKLYPGVSFEGDVYIGNGVQISNEVHIERGVYIEKEVIILAGAYIEKEVTIKSGTRIESDAHIKSCSRIESGSRIGADRRGVTKCLVVKGIGITKSLTAIACDDGLIVTIGCLNDYKGDTIENARKAVSEKYDPDHEYFDALNLCEKWYKNLKG